MACIECQEAQEIRSAIARGEAQGALYYVRVGTSDLEIVGCRMHVKELVDKLKGSDSGPIPDSPLAEEKGRIIRP